MLRQIVGTIIDTVLPRQCLGCGKEGKYVCEQCDLFLSEAPTLLRQGNLEEVASGWEYEGLIKDIIWQIKYQGIFDAINELVPRVLATRDWSWPAGTIITFVPMFQKKERKRGFNQAELIARQLGEITKLLVLPLLEKIRDTASQTDLDKAERFANVKGSFQPKGGCAWPGQAQPNNVLLVDDVWTSGATMRECARVLKRAGAQRIFGFTLARTV